MKLSNPAADSQVNQLMEYRQYWVDCMERAECLNRAPEGKPTKYYVNVCRQIIGDIDSLAARLILG